MKNRTWILAGLLAVSAAISGCGTGAPVTIPETITVSNAESQVISVSSREKVMVVPDMAEISYSVYSQASDAETCQTQNAQDLNRVIELLKSEGVAERSIQTSCYGMNPIYDWDNGQSITGYEMTTQVTVSDIPIDQVGQLASRSVEAGINRIDSVRYLSSEYSSAYQEALAKAVKAAEEKAQTLAETGGCTLGEIVRIEEYSPNQEFRYENGYDAGAKWESAKLSAGEDMAVMPGEVEVEAEITVVFAIH